MVALGIEPKFGHQTATTRLSKLDFGHCCVDMPAFTKISGARAIHQGYTSHSAKLRMVQLALDACTCLTRRLLKTLRLGIPVSLDGFYLSTV